jgi:hypothetical protein
MVELPNPWMTNRRFELTPEIEDKLYWQIIEPPLFLSNPRQEFLESCDENIPGRPLVHLGRA